MFVEKISDLVDQTDAILHPHTPTNFYGAGDPHKDTGLPDEVRTAYLRNYPDAQLAGRLAYFEREAIFERNPVTRKQFRQEAQRTQTEINRRKMYLRAEAERVFEL